MSQRDNFSGGFFLGTIVGGIVGGVIGALLASGRLGELVSSDEDLLESEKGAAKPTNAGRVLKPTNGQGDMEVARRSLEDKIAQLNEAIDDVRHQLGGMNTRPEEKSRSIPKEP